jgi:hypothetical protein
MYCIIYNAIILPLKTLSLRETVKQVFFIFFSKKSSNINPEVFGNGTVDD